ncbi:GNAT family N-acetyltransferase [Pelagibius sp. Alg239-R121]|uniref:GNAT family N-acetyltransferase n=1 Tax=Pelagibius sp. Alg239-R121 TaxID=2993448 RepID=UPI0024A62314|nr:GNAT family N-acetyltransferase [Pelagibius sp. Alg239-R121]
MNRGTNVRIREAVIADVPQIVWLLADDDIGVGRERLEEPLPACYLEAFGAVQADSNSLLVVAEDGGEVIGCLQLSVMPGLSFQGLSRAQIEDVRVASLHRGSGIGLRLMDWAEAEARKRGCRMLQLLVHEDRTDARRFYRSSGFNKQHRGMRKMLG